MLTCIGLPRCSPSQHHYFPFSLHKRYIIRLCLIRSSLSAQSSCFVPPHCNHTTLKDVTKHFLCSIVVQKVLVALLLVTNPPISSVLHTVKDLRVGAAPMLSVREATNATTRQLEPDATCPRDLLCLLSRQKTPTSRSTPLCHLLALFLAPTELEPTPSLERNRMHGSSTESLGPPCPRVSRSPTTYARTGSALSPVHEKSTNMMLDSRGMVSYAPPTTSLPTTAAVSAGIRRRWQADSLQRLHTYFDCYCS